MTSNRCKGNRYEFKLIHSLLKNKKEGIID